MNRIFFCKLFASLLVFLLVLQCTEAIESDENINESIIESTSTHAPISSTIAIDAILGNSTELATADLSNYLREIIPVAAQPRFFSVLNSLFRVFRFFFRSLNEGIHFYKPEIRLGRCMIKFARNKYPELRRRLSYENLLRFGMRMYGDISVYASDLLSENRSEEWLKRNRIASKVMELNDDEPQTRQADDDSRLENSQQNKIMMMKQRLMASRRMDGRPLRRVAYMAPRHMRQRRDDSNTNRLESTADDSSVVMRIESDPIADDDSNDNDEFHELNEKSWDELLDFDSVLYDSLGIDRKMAKEWTPINCAKEYTVQFLKRFIIGFMTGEIWG